MGIELKILRSERILRQIGVINVIKVLDYIAEISCFLINEGLHEV